MPDYEVPLVVAVSGVERHRCLRGRFTRISMNTAGRLQAGCSTYTKSSLSEGIARVVSSKRIFA